MGGVLLRYTVHSPKIEHAMKNEMQKLFLFL